MQIAQTQRNRRHFIASVSTWAAATACTFEPLALAQSATSARVLVLGDSLSAEYGLERGTGWVALLAQRLASRKQPVTLINASVSGETTAGGRARLPALLRQHQPTIVIIELGANDALRGLTLASARDNLRAMTQAAQEAGAKVLLVGVEMPPNYGRKYAQDFVQLYVEVATQRKAALTPSLLKGVADAPNPTALFQADRIHPTAQAQPLMLDNVWPQLSALLGP